MLVMKSSDLLLSVLIIGIFLVLISGNLVAAKMDGIKKNWNKYKCSPIFMPLAGYFGHDPVQNFTFCMSNLQTLHFGKLLQPIEYVMNVLSYSLGNAFKFINSIREKMGDFVMMIQNIVQTIFGVFVNMLIQFQNIMIKLKDTFVKTMGIAFTTMHLVETGMNTGKSIWNGPIGDSLRFVCFDPATPVKLANGQYKQMKDMNLGELLHGNHRVMSVMRIVGNSYNESENALYRIYSKELNTWIYVTQNHKIRNKHDGRFIPVHRHPDAIHTSRKVEELSCLVVDDHIIPIGEHEFWDWED
jgi:hypothetical protein